MSATPKQYRKKPVVIEAMQFPVGGKSQQEVAHWIRESGAEAKLYDGNVAELDEPATDGSLFMWRSMTIVTLEGNMWAEPGDYIIKGVEGEFYPCRPGIFKATYEDAQ